MAKIFYSSSTNSDSANRMKELIISKKDNILDIDDYSKPYILEKILNTINDSNIFVCDITPNNTQDYSLFILFAGYGVFCLAVLMYIMMNSKRSVLLSMIFVVIAVLLYVLFVFMIQRFG